MRRVEIFDPCPTVIHCNINIAHHQLRDLLQPAAEKGKVLFVNGLKIDCADFNTKKVPTTFSTLDFTAVCLTTGSGLVAAGGQQSELDIRPLLPLSSCSNDPSNGESSSSANNITGNQHSKWHLRTPTGGSINNSICIQPDLSRKSIHSHNLPGVALMGGSTAINDDKDVLCRHREKRRKEISELMDEEAETQSTWRRDDPSGRMKTGINTISGEPSRDRLDAIVERNRIGLVASEQEKKRQGEEKANAQRGEVFTNGLMRASSLTQFSGSMGGSVRVLVSNNDQSVKEFRLRPPTRWRPSNATGSGGVERIESGLPGLSRLQTVEFPTCINHSSFSPDGRHLVSVGDTPEVFLYSVDPVSGELSQIATYNASSDASFCTSWSPDGLQFAVASQDGLVSIWDVRSSTKVASLQTSQISDVTGSGAARVVKWSPRGDLLAYSEHKNYIHIVDTSTFKTSQRIKVPSGAAGQTRNAACNTETTDGEATGSDEVDVDDILHSSTDTSTSASQGLLEATARHRIAAGIRNGNSTNSRPPPWHGERRLRELISGGNIMRSPLDRALLGEWSSSRIGRGHRITDDVEVYIDNNNSSSTIGSSSSGSPTTGSTTRTSITNDTSTSMLARSVDSIMATFETESGLRNGASGIWSVGISRRGHRCDDAIDISGLTWDPDGDYLYVSTEDLIAQYSVLDLRRSFGQAVMR